LWPKADILIAWAMSAFGGKADIGSLMPARCHVAFVSRGVAGKFRECPEIAGNKREQIATRRNMKFAAIENKILILLSCRGGLR
jgi:hypothetical protein